MRLSDSFFLLSRLAFPFRKINGTLYKTLLCLGLGLCLSPGNAGAQDLPDATTNYALPSLDSLIGLGLKTAPSLKFSDAQIQMQRYQVKSRKLQWTNFISAGLGAGVGNLFLWNGNDENGAFTTRLIPQYRAGINVNLPLNQFLDRKNQVGMAESQHKAAVFQKEMEMQAFTERITTLYFQLVTNINVLKIRRDALQTMQIQKALAEKNMQNGNIGLVEMSAIVREYANAQESYETFKQSFLMTWKQMEYLVGQPLKLIP